VFTWIQKVLRGSKSEQGSALAIVIIMVVFVGLWFGSVAVLTNSGQAILKNAVTNSNVNSSMITSMLDRTVQSLTPNQTVRYGSLAYPCDSLTLPSYTDPTTGDLITVQCSSAPFSGNTYGQSLSLVGTGDPAAASSVIGVDGGLAFVSNNGNTGGTTCTATASDTGRYVIFGGLFNASGMWQNTNCMTLEMNLSTSTLTSDSSNQLPSANQVASAQLTVPTTQTQPSATNWSTATAGTIAAGCPNTTAYTSPTGATSTVPAACTYDSTAATTTSSSSYTTTDVGAYQTAVENLLPSAGTGLATYSGEAATPGSLQACNITTTYAGIPAVVWTPGILNDALIADLNAMTSVQGCAKNKAPAAVIFSPGTYLFQPTNPVEWRIDGGSTVILGSPLYNPSTPAFSNIVGCDTTKSGGQFQFAGPIFMQMALGELYLCPDKITSGQPTVVIADHNIPNSTNTGTKVPAWNPNKVNNPTTGLPSSRTKNFLFVSQGNNNSNNCAICITSEGLVYSPGASFYINLTGTSRGTFGQGAVLKAATLNTNGSTKRTMTSKPPVTSTKGDRHVQLKFTNVTKKKTIGVVQLTIKDNFGQSYGNGFKIDTWAVK